MFACTIKDRPLLTTKGLFILIFLIGLIVRIIVPELKLLHHDEAIHAWFTYELLTKGTYLYDPMYHGPLLYYLTGAAFLFFSDSDLIARLLPALFGSAIIPLFYILYKEDWLSKNHMLFASLFFALSPSMVYFSRFLRHDIFQLFFTILLMVSLLLYFDKGRWQYAILAAISAACGLSLKEDMPFTILIFGSFFLFMFMAGRIALPSDWKRDVIASILIMTGIGMVFYTTFFTHPEMFLQAPFKAIEHWTGIHGACRLCGGPYWYLLIIGLYEMPIMILAIAGAWYYGVREQGFKEIKAGILGYYNNLRSRRELLRSYVGIPDKYRFIALFAIYWTILSMAFYAYVGEKVPWLIIHQLFPLILIASYQISGKKMIFAAIACVYLVLMMAHVCYTPTDINEPIVQVQNSEEMREVMKMIDTSGSVVVASESYWPLPWYYRGDRWNKVVFYGNRVDPDTFSPLDPDMIITHDTDSYESLEGYEKRQYKLSYWFSWYENENRLFEYYFLRDGKSGSINLDVFVKPRISQRVNYSVQTA
jgi:uncharacterized protein (TIGR03663 family)